MCLAIPGQIMSVSEDGAWVNFGGVSRIVHLDLLPGAAPGDHVLVHAGFAIQILNPRDAIQWLRPVAGAGAKPFSQRRLSSQK